MCLSTVYFRFSRYICLFVASHSSVWSSSLTWSPLCSRRRPLLSYPVPAKEIYKKKRIHSNAPCICLDPSPLSAGSRTRYAVPVSFVSVTLTKLVHWFCDASRSTDRVYRVACYGAVRRWGPRILTSLKIQNSCVWAFKLPTVAATDAIDLAVEKRPKRSLQSNQSRVFLSLMVPLLLCILPHTGALFHQPLESRFLLETFLLAYL